MRRNISEIFLENYNYALSTSINNLSWQDKITHFPEILSEYLGTTKTLDIVGDDIDVQNLIEYKQKNNLKFISPKVLYLKNNKKDIAKKLINNVFQKTSYFAHMIKNLLDEFGENKRKFAHYKITPYPEEPTDTYFPIKKFKVNSDIGSFISELIKNGMIIKNCPDEDMKDYFVNRCLNKTVKTGYLDNIPNYDHLKRKLVFVKFLPLPNITNLSVHPKKYKVRYIGNQTVRNENDEYSISNEPINIIYMEKLS
jgi:hypothetical protein